MATQRTFDITANGAVGDGIADDWAAIQDALQKASTANGCLYIPAGRYHCSHPLSLLGLRRNIAIRGDGQNVSILVATGGENLLSLSFDQLGANQPWGLNLVDVSFRAVGRAGTAITVSYGNPAVTNDHFQPSVVMRGVTVASDHLGSWSNGIRVEAAWNVSMTDVYVSGHSFGGRWNELSGRGIQLDRMCVNSHFANVHCNFWAVGFCAHASAGINTEGLFFSNCSMVAVKRGVWIAGDAGNRIAPRISTLTWTGGLIECRVGGVLDGSAAFHLQNVWTALIQGVQCITETLTCPTTTYGIIAQDCNGLVVTGCDLNAWNRGVFTTGKCAGITVVGNTFTNTAEPVAFGSGCTSSKAHCNVRVDGAKVEDIVV